MYKLRWPEYVLKEQEKVPTIRNGMKRFSDEVREGEEKSKWINKPPSHTPVGNSCNTRTIVLFIMKQKDFNCENHVLPSERSGQR